MRCEELIKKLEEEYPLNVAEDWDNPGLLVGRRHREVSRVLVALDATEETIGQAIDSEADLIVTHHPLIFRSVSQVTDDSFIGRRILAMIEHGISCYAMHTNFDVLGMAHLNEKQLSLQDTHVLCVTRESDGIVEGLGRVGDLEEPMTLRQTAAFVRRSLGIDAVRCYGLEEREEGDSGEKQIQRIAVCGGSGKGMVQAALDEGAQVLVTGDVDYHTAIDALAQGLNIIDAGHYGTEYGFIAYMGKKMRKLFPELDVIEARTHHPFEVI